MEWINNNESGFSVRNKLNNFFNLISNFIDNNKKKDWIFFNESFIVSESLIAKICLVDSSEGSINILVPNLIALDGHLITFKFINKTNDVQFATMNGAQFIDIIEVEEGEAITMAFKLNTENNIQIILI